jgi:autotransporter-associated beta strand protein
MRMLRKEAILAVAIAGALMSVVGAQGAETHWMPAAVSGLWSDPLNWSAGVPQSGDAIGFGPSAITAVNNDLAAEAWLSGIAFDPDAGAYTVGGSALQLGGSITSGSALVQTVAVPLTLQTDLTVNNGAGNLVLNGAISGAYGLTKSGGGSLVLSGANTFTGPTLLREGTTLLSGTLTTDAVRTIRVATRERWQCSRSMAVRLTRTARGT